MFGKTMGRDRRGMTISVTILGLALLTVMLAYLVFGDNNDQEGLASLRLVNIMFRHGDRSPNGLYPNDPHINHVWLGGLGELTEQGSLQMYNLGKHLRMRYYKLLPSNGLYSKENMHVYSSAKDRCVMSGASFLAGFMPPLENRNPLPIGWQPIPIQVLPREKDTLIAQKKPCPRYEDTLNRLYTNPPKELRELNEKNQDLYKYLTEHSGKNITNVLDVELLYNILEVEQDAGLVLPDWTETVFPDKMLNLFETSLSIFTYTPFMKKIKGGSILTEFLDNMHKRSTLPSGIGNINNNNDNTNNVSIYIYSAHDITLVNLMRTLGCVDQTTMKPEYGATIVFELHHSVIFEDDFEVKIVYYYNSEDKFPKELSIPNCNAPCSLAAFSKSIEKLIVRNYDEICKLF